LGSPFPDAGASGIRLGLDFRAAAYTSRTTSVSTITSAATLTSMSGDFTPREVAVLHERGEIELIDVREPEEWDAGRIAGSRHVQLTELSAQADSLPRDRPIVFVCRSGSRSAMATQAFAGAGFDAHNMSGGLLEWKAGGLPLEPADGRVA
jgi:rhodanese-related sulfurtransferase